MDLQKVLAQLRSELENLDAAILSLERLQLNVRRRGRPPSWLNGNNKKSPRPPHLTKTAGAAEGGQPTE